MAIGDIQLTSAAMAPPVQHGADAATPYQSNVRGAEIGEASTSSKATPDELKNGALPREQVEQFLWEIKQQPAWRKEADRAADYYDGNQLTPETVERLKDRGQPPLIANLIAPTIDTVLGMEAKTRTDWRVRPEDDDEANDDLAEAVSVKLKHAEIESRADRACSDAYAGQLKTGMAWVEVGREHDPFKCNYRVKSVHRREIAWDWRAESFDMSDCRYLIRRRWLELDEAIAMMPQYAELFRQTTGGWAGFDPMHEQDSTLVQSWEVERDTKLAADDWRDLHRQRVCLYEIWYRKWVRAHVMELPNGRVMECDFNDPRHCEAILAGIATVKMATFQKVRLAWYTGPHFLFDVPSPYKHNMFPYVPFYGHREDLTNVPYGLIRAMIPPQDEVNARKSKMLWSLNARRVVTDSDAVKDHNQAMSEVSRPDAYIILDSNRKPNSKFVVEPGGELAAQQFQVMQESKQEIAEASGIHKSMQGQTTGATSGIAVNTLVEQGLNTLAEINDNYRFARRLVGEMLFSLVQEDLAKGPKKVTVGEGKKKKVIVLNQPAQDPETGQMVMMNDVAKLKAKIVLDDIPSTPTYRMQQLQMLSEITKSLPENLQGMIIDFVIEATDLPKRHELADRLRGAVGIQDDSPEAQQAQQQAAQQQQALAARAAELELAAKQATVEKMQAETQQIIAGLPQQGQGDNEEVAQIQQQAQQAIAQLQDEIGQLQQQVAEKEQLANDKRIEMQSKEVTAVATAKIDAQAKISVAKIAKDAEDKVQHLAQQLADAQKQLAELSKAKADQDKAAEKEAATEKKPPEEKKVKKVIHVKRDANNKIIGAEVEEVST